MKLILLIFFLSLSLFAEPKNSNTQLQNATSLMDKGKYKEAAEILGEYVALHPKNVIALYNGALSYLYSGRADIALNYLQRFKLYATPDADVLNLLGMAHERSGNDDSAKYYYDACIKKERNYYEAYLNRGKFYVKKEKIDSAFADFNYAKRNKIINPELYMASGDLYYKCDIIDSALKDLQKIIKYKDKDPYYLSLIGNIHYIKKSFDSAVKYYTKLIKLDSTNIAALNNRAMCYDQLEANDKAKEDRNIIAELQKKIAINPTTINYQKLISKDSTFSIDIPTNWQALARQSDTVDQIIFFNPKFDNNKINDAYIYDCGGVINYNKKFWTPDTTKNNIMQREALIDAHINNIKKQFQNSEWFEIMRRRFNPNEKTSRILMKTNFTDKINQKKYYQTTYITITADGRMIEANMWIPYESMFIHEPLFDKIQETLTLIK